MQIALVLRNKLLLARSGRGTIGALLQTLATRLGIVGLNIGASVITARTMGAEGRGMLAALLTWPQFIAYLTTFGLTASLLYNVKSDVRQRGRLLATAIVLTLLAGLVACLIGVALMPWMLPAGSSTELLQARLLMTVAPAILVALAVQTAAEAVGDFPGANALRGVSVLGTFSGVALLATTHTLTPLGAALCYLLPQIPVGVWLFWRLRPHYQPTLRGFQRSARTLVAYGLRCYPVELLGNALSYAGQALVIALLTPADVGYFAVALGISRILDVVYSTVATILLPKTAGRRSAEVADETARAARLTLLLMTALVVPIALVLPLLMPAVYGADFVQGVPIARLLLVEVALNGTVFVAMQAFLAIGRPELPALSQAVTLILLVPLLLVVVPRHGAVGAAAGLALVAVVKLALTAGLYRAVLKAPMLAFLPGRADLRYAYALLQR